MKQNAIRYDAYAKESATGFTKGYVDRILARADKIRNDPNKKKRESESLCVYCFYDSPRIGGAAMTKRDCGLCGVEMMFGSTCTDVICNDCAKEKHACKHCGADLDLKHRRKF